jgi:hypothetical protein
MAHASDNTPEPMTAVMMCEEAVHTVPVRFSRPSSSKHLLPPVVVCSAGASSSILEVMG